MDMLTIGRNLRRLRVEAGLTRPQLAAMSGVSIPSVAAIEAGLWRGMECRTLIGFCAALHCRASDLLGDDGLHL